MNVFDPISPAEIKLKLVKKRFGRYRFCMLANNLADQMIEILRAERKSGVDSNEIALFSDLLPRFRRALLFAIPAFHFAALLGGGSKATKDGALAYRYFRESGYFQLKEL